MFVGKCRLQEFEPQLCVETVETQYFSADSLFNPQQFCHTSSSTEPKYVSRFSLNIPLTNKFKIAQKIKKPYDHLQDTALPIEYRQMVDVSIKHLNSRQVAEYDTAFTNSGVDQVGTDNNEDFKYMHAKKFQGSSSDYQETDDNYTPNSIPYMQLSAMLQVSKLDWTNTDVSFYDAAFWPSAGSSALNELVSTFPGRKVVWDLGTVGSEMPDAVAVLPGVLYRFDVEIAMTPYYKQGMWFTAYSLYKWDTAIKHTSVSRDEMAAIRDLETIFRFSVLMDVSQKSVFWRVRMDVGMLLISIAKALTYSLVGYSLLKFWQNKILQLLYKYKPDMDPDSTNYELLGLDDEAHEQYNVVRRLVQDEIQRVPSLAKEFTAREYRMIYRLNSCQDPRILGAYEDFYRHTTEIQKRIEDERKKDENSGGSSQGGTATIDHDKTRPEYLHVFRERIKRIIRKNIYVHQDELDSGFDELGQA